MKIDSRYYDEMFNQFAQKCKEWADRSVRCVPKHEHAIRVFLDNGDKVDYNVRTETFKYTSAVSESICKPKDISDDECRNAFSYNLVELMRTKGCGQQELSERTGLSTSVISKYANKATTPTITSLIRIAKALDCDVNDLLY